MSVKLIFVKGGPGSGHHGHSGLPGVHGGSRPGKGSNLEGSYVVLFHATQDEFLEGIKEEGLVQGRGHWTREDSALFFVGTLHEAEQIAVQLLGNRGDPLSGRGREGTVKDVAIIKFRVPRAVYEKAKVDHVANDDFGLKTAKYIVQDVPVGDLISAEVLVYDNIKFVRGTTKKVPVAPGGILADRGIKFVDHTGFHYEYDEIERSVITYTKEKKDYVDIYQVVILEYRIEEKQLPITEADKAKLFQLRRSMFFDRSDDLAEQLFTGEISIGEWQEAFKDSLRQYYSSAAAIGKGGWDEMSWADWGRLGPVMKDQYGYLQKYAEYISKNRDTVSLKYIKARSRLYGEGAGFGAALIEAGTVFENLLPFLPRDGSTECLNRCHCRWENTIFDREGQWFQVRSIWYLGEADHCTTCLSRAGRLGGTRVVVVNRVHENVNVPAVIGGY